ncbi:MAG: hypothetical protein LIO86_13450 [Lachnospiraceae bacterium]|nr:hypothetical protein [Lachnospiraceae bacterium]
MSNPGVITLTEKEISPTKSFRVEDNLGEAVHFHYNDIRIDLSIRELLYIADVCDDTIHDLVPAKNFRPDEFDNDFLNQISQYLIDLTEIRSERVALDSLCFVTKNRLHLPVRKKLNRKYALKLVAENSDSKTAFQPILFNDNPTVMYGISAVAAAYLKSSRGFIDVRRMYFTNDNYSVPSRPWIPYLFRWDRKRLVRTAKKMAARFLQ